MVKLVKESKSVATKYKSSIVDDIDDALTDIFIKYQDELGIESGDVEPFDHLEYTSIMERLADCVVKILDYECGDKITKKSGKSIKKR